MKQHSKSGTAFEDEYGYARAVRVGDTVWVSGTTASDADLDKDVYGQAKSALATISGALAGLDCTLGDAVRTTSYVTSMGDVAELAKAHREAFDAARLASTVVEVAKLTPESARVEIEVTAIAGSSD